MAPENPDAEPRAVSICILKGGFGKTTTTVNVGRELAERNGSALVVDLDENGHLTRDLGFKDVYEGETNHAREVLLNKQDPREYTVNVAGGLDLFPAHDDLENVESDLETATMGMQRIDEHLVKPLLGDEYDYIILDCPPSRGRLNDNAMFATNNLIIPLRPEHGYETGLDNTLNRLVSNAREYFELNILAITPTDLSQRIDQNTDDRELLEELCRRPNIAKHVPNFAYLSESDFEALENGGFDGELPGIRQCTHIGNSLDEGKALRDYAPQCDQLDAYGELAKIVEEGEVDRDV